MVNSKQNQVFIFDKYAVCQLYFLGPSENSVFGYAGNDSSAALEISDRKKASAMISPSRCFLKKRRCTWILIILTLSFMLDAEWTRIGLAGKEVTALAMRKIWSDTTILAGTHEGVWRKSITDTGFTPLKNISPSDPEVFPLNIHTLYFADNVPRLWAADDSGLAVYTFTSGLPPAWKRTADIPAMPVTDITGAGDNLFCCTGPEVYRSFDGGTAWTACSTRAFLPMLGNITSFTSLALFYGINAGSKSLGAMNSWQGVMSSADYGKTWSDISNLAGQGKPLGQVFEMLAYAPLFSEPQRLLAATETGLQFFLGDKDTGVWHNFEPDLEKVIPNALSVGYFTRSFLADLWAASDSGAYRLHRSNPLSWVRLSSQKTFCIIPNRQNDPDRWYAATDDGVWEYFETVPIIARNKIMRSDRICPYTRYYSINGRLLKKNQNNFGVVLVKELIGTKEIIIKKVRF